MRWKLLVIASLAAVIAGTGVGMLLLYLLTGWPVPTARGGPWPVVVALLPRLAAITYASVFVYRRTARRRRLQAVLTALVSLALAFVAHFAYYTPCCGPPVEQTPPAPAPRNVG